MLGTTPQTARPSCVRPSPRWTRPILRSERSRWQEAGIQFPADMVDPFKRMHRILAAMAVRDVGPALLCAQPGLRYVVLPRVRTCWLPLGRVN